LLGAQEHLSTVARAFAAVRDLDPYPKARQAILGDAVEEKTRI
jgi:hypothetical protein